MTRFSLVVLLMLAFLEVTVTGNDDHQPPSTVGGSGGENKFLKYLFNKYGSKGVISFEGLEHLMHSLGLGGLDFTPSHTLDEHRPEGFKTSDMMNSLSMDYNESDPQQPQPQEKVTVSFNSIDDDRTRLSNYDDASSSGTKSTDRNRRAESHYHHHPQEPGQDIISSMDQIKKFNELPPVVDRSNENSTTASTIAGHKDVSSSSSAEDDNGKWHNEIWQEIIFKEIHDPQHRHPRRDDRRKACLSPMSMVHLILEEPQNGEEILRQNFNYDLGSIDGRHRRSLPHAHAPTDHVHEVEEILAARIKITPSTFKDLCPALLAQIDQKACIERYQDQPLVEKKLFSYAWLYATVCVLIISICGLAGVAIVPLAKSVAYDEILRFLVALAIGTLCGDALMHLLPHALIPHEENSGLDHDHDHGSDHSHANEPVWLCCCAFLCALLMYTLETVLPLLRSEDDADGHHGHSHARSKVAPVPEPAQVRRNTNVVDDIELDLQDTKRKELNSMLEKKPKQSKPLTPVAFMVILGDGLHNITDGLAIGAAFAADPVTGMATSFAILCHELPHELGDFALLLQTGVSIRRAMFLNVVSSVLSFLGMLIGLLVTGLHESVVRWIYAGTAGTFLYIALADLIPELNRDLRETIPSDQRCKKLRAIWSQICGIFLGGMIMLVIALNEDHLRVLFE
ncbi:zinc transporter ZIP10 [Armigeres subalbatus]|uniref:zinc transporter ZIP10 n=1 Tax=Armigeres subalbatus TaxID=124917 RepID=UPI002ED67A36